MTTQTAVAGPSLPVSVVVPVHDGGDDLAECLAALHASVGVRLELIVVDDGSHDDSATVAHRAGARVLSLERNLGAGAARNRGARLATNDVLVFIDADVLVRPDTVARLATTLAAHPDVAAVFGSYDDAPRAFGLVSQYRNLLHHFVHQHGDRDASTFWSGCGAMRRAVFESLGGFDEGPHSNAIEDIELGYRLRAAGHRIVLDPTVQVTHLKRWTLVRVLWTDAFLRALPWSRLLLARRTPHDHLNVQTGQRVSVALTLLATAAGAATPLVPAAGALALVAALAVALTNRRLLAFFVRARGWRFALATVPLLLLHYLESGLCYGAALLERAVGRAPSRTVDR